MVAEKGLEPLRTLKVPASKAGRRHYRTTPRQLNTRSRWKIGGTGETRTLK